MNEDEVSESDLENRILRPPDEREVNRIKPNPTVKIQPIFIDPGHGRSPPVKGNRLNKNPQSGMCLEISGRVQHANDDMKNFIMDE